MSRLVDYIAIYGYNFDAASRRAEQACSGQLIQRFPKQDRADVEFVANQEVFCQPCGWRLSRLPQHATYFVQTFTAESGQQCYSAMLSVHEPLSMQQRRQLFNISSGGGAGSGVDEDAVSASNIQPVPSSLSLVDSDADTETVFVAAALAAAGAQTGESQLQHQVAVYAPKTLVLQSRLDLPETLHDCLVVLYAAHAAGRRDHLEEMIARLLSSVFLPTNNSYTVFSLLPGFDCQILQSLPSDCCSVPATGSVVVRLFRQLGIHNSVKLVTALLTGCKVVLFSASFTQLTDACRALKALLYPFKYEYTLVPIMPKPLLEYVCATVPYLYGVHSSFKRQIEDCTESMFDLITADLDLGCVAENWSGCGGGQSSIVTPLSDQVLQNLLADITDVLNPGLATADRAFKKPTGGTLRSCVSAYGGGGDDFWLDKQIRAAFMRAFAEIVNGYRSCLVISRILPSNVINFHYASFLGGRGLVDDKFMRRLATESEMFCQFCQARGPPYRRIDAFDELYDRLSELQAAEAAELLLPPPHQLALCVSIDADNDNNADSSVSPTDVATVAIGRRLRRRHLDELAKQLCECETSITTAVNNNSEAEKVSVNVPQPPDDPAAGPPEPFPLLNERLVAEAIEAEEAKREVDDAMAAASGRTGSDPAARRGSPAKSSKPSAASTKALEQPSQQQDHQRRRQEFKKVPPGQRLEDLLLPPTQQQFSSSADIHRQKLQILELCVKNVFERRIADAKKSLKAVKRDLAHRSSRLRLVDLLNDMVVARGMSTLDQQQFEIACELLVQALRFDAQHEEWLCALRCLPLLERLRCQLPCQNSTASLELQASMTEEVQACTAWSSEAFWHWAFSRFVQTQLCDYYVGRLAEWKPDEPVDPSATALDIVAKVMQHSEQLSTAELEELKKIEEETVESAAKHFIVILAALRMPLEPAKRRWAGGGGNRRDVGVSELSSTNQGGGGPGGGSSQTESQESQHQQHHQASQSQAEREANAAAAKLSEQFARELEAWIRDRFLDRVCSENGLSQSQINSLKRTLHEFLHSVHMESLDNIWAEYCKIPKSQKARITRPALLPGERLLMPQLRAYLYPDGRRDPVRLELESCETADYLHHQTLTAATAVSAAVVVAGAPATAAEFTPDIGWLPAEGLFLATNYRLIFKGVPSNVLQSEKTIVRCFPIAALHKAKELSKSERDPALLASVQNRHSVRQQVLFKSGTFEAMKIGFDAGEDEISELLERIQSARHPGSVREIFALSADGGRLVGDLDDEFADTPLPVTASAAAAALPTTAMEASATGTGAGSSGGVKIKKPKKLHSKPYTLTRRLAKQTTSAAHAAANKLMTLRPGAAGVSSHRQHQQEHQWRSSLRPPPSPAAPGSAAIPGSERSSMHDSDEAIAARFSGYSGATSRHHQPSRPTSELLRDTLETPGYEDLHRLGLLGKQLTDAICLRICCANFEHDLVSSYPAVLIVPRAVTDESLRRLTKAHRQCRFPVVVWRCHSNGALLFRSGSFQGKSLAWAGGLGSGGGGSTAAADGAEVGRFSEEQERLFQALSACAHASSLAGCIATGSNHDAAADDAIQSSADALSEGDELADDSKEILVAAVAPVGDNGDDGDSSVSDEPPMSNSDSNDEYHDVEEAPGVEVGDEAAAGPSSAGVDKQPLSPMLEEDSSGLSDIVDSRQDRGDGISDFSSRRRGHGVGVGGGGNNQLDRLFSSVRSGAAKLKTPSDAAIASASPRASVHFNTTTTYSTVISNSSSSTLPRCSQLSAMTQQQKQQSSLLTTVVASSRHSGLSKSLRSVLLFTAKGSGLTRGSRSPASMGPDSRLSSSSLEPVVGSGSQTKIHLYIFTDRSAVAKIRAHRIEGAELVPIDDYPTAHAIRDSYKRLIKVCLPGKPLPLYSTTGGAGKSKKSFLHAFEDTKWLSLVQCLLDLAGAVVNLVACQARSVLLALEDGWDSTAAVLSLSQIMLDQHYRTIAGFRSLLEKDWLLFGHQFDARFGRLKGPESGHFAPVFLLFLDSVHQLLHQFPLSFEFNQHFLLTLAYHTVGCRFANFLGNCELDRLYADIGSADFWAYLDTQMAVSTAYLNLAYAPEMAAAAAGEGSANRQSRKQNKQQRLTAVLRPVTAQALLQRWTYFTREEAAYGASADPDLYSQERRWHLAATEAKSASSMKDAAAVAAEAAAAAEQQLDRQQQQQQAVDEEVELGYNYYADGASKLGSAIEELAAINGIDCLDVWHRLHRKATSIRLRHQRRRRRQNSPSALIAVGGADGGDANAAAAAIAAKRWHIDQSRQLLSRALLNTSAAATPVTSTAASTTTAAGMAASVVSGPTPPVRPPPPQISTPSAPEPTRTSPEDVESAASPFVATPQRPPIRPPPPKRPASTMSTMQLSTKPTLGSGSLEATLHKQGKLLKQWAPRQFVLDPVRHQLRYWDAHRDPSGSRASELSLAELHSVRLSGRAPAGAPSKVPEAAFFELVKSNQRVIRLYANTPKLATEWVEKLSSAISQ